MPPKFLGDMQHYLEVHINSFYKYLKLLERCSKHSKLREAIKCDLCANLLQGKIHLLKANCLNDSQVKAFVDLCLSKVKKAIVEPGTAVGAVAATSIGKKKILVLLFFK